jgi:predicted phage terminase large subunit-like protein
MNAPLFLRYRLTAALRLDLVLFIAKVLQTVAPGDKYQHNWHIEALVHVLRTVLAGDTKRLIVSMPPRSLKSITISVALVAWALGRNPSLRFLCVSYSAELAAALGRQFRAVVTSQWYRELFPEVHFIKVTETECETSTGGRRLALGVGGSITGRGGKIIIVDDPMKAEDAQSEAVRKAVDDWFRSTLLTRQDDKLTSSIIVAAQRLHEDDLTGMLLRSGRNWNHLELPAICPDDRHVVVGAGRTYAWREGEALQPAREPLAVLEELRVHMGSQKFSAQYLQAPVPATGNTIKRAWVQYYDVLPSRPGGEIVQSWDIATTLSDSSDYSVCTTWWRHRGKYYLLDVWRGRLEFPMLKRQVVTLARQSAPGRILIEDVGPGLNLVQEFRANPTPGVPQPVGVRPEGDKEMRMQKPSARFEGEQVLFPREAPWLADLLSELLAFPHGRHDDQVDSISLFLNWAERDEMMQPLVSVVGPIVLRG